MANDKIYVGNGKEVDTQYGKLLKLSFSKLDLETMLGNLNQKGYINLNVNARKEPGKFGETHYMTVDNWKPDQKAQPTRTNQAEINIADIPF